MQPRFPYRPSFGGLLFAARRRRIRLLRLIAGFFCTGVFATNAAESRPLSLRYCIEQALAKNFDVRVDREEGLLAQAQLGSAAAAYVPTVNVGVAWDRINSPASTSSSGTTSSASQTDTTSWTAGLTGQLSTGATYSFSTNLAALSGQRSSSLLSGSASSYDTVSGKFGVISLTQPLFKNLRIDSTRLTISQRKIGVRSAELTAFDRAIATVAAVEQAYDQFVASGEAVKVREAALALAQRTLDDTLSRLKIGVLAPLDEKQAQSSVASAESDLLTARQTQRERANSLKLLISDDYTAWRDVEITASDALTAEPVALDYITSLGRALANRPDLGQLALTRDQRELSVRYQRDQRLPQVDLTGNYGLSGSDTNTSSVVNQWRDRDYPSYSVGVAVSFPWTDKKARNEVRYAEGQERQARLRVEQQRDVIRSQIDNALSSVRTGFEKISATRRAREYAESALAAEQDKLAAGKSTNFTVLQLQKDLTSARSDEIAALAAYNDALSVLRQREASSLDHWRIAFDRALSTTN